jgi:hypothetical protein
MMAPSPDWISGITAVDMCMNGFWTKTKTVTGVVYDAGVDGGIYFRSANDPQALNTNMVTEIVCDAMYNFNGPFCNQANTGVNPVVEYDIVTAIDLTLLPTAPPPAPPPPPAAPQSILYCKDTKFKCKTKKCNKRSMFGKKCQATCAAHCLEDSENKKCPKDKKNTECNPPEGKPPVDCNDTNTKKRCPLSCPVCVPEKPFNCYTKEVWSNEKIKWCCDNKQIGCLA